MTSTGVVVVGGGITGLSAAFELSRARVPTILVESSPRFGGKIETQRSDGFLIEAGPDSFISYRPAAIELASELGLGDRLVRPSEPRVVFIHAGGRSRPMPTDMGMVLPGSLGPFITTPLLSPGQKLRAALDILLPRTVLDHDVGVGPYLRRRLGAAVVDRLAGPLVGGVYGTPVDELSLLAVVPQLRDAEVRHRSLLVASLSARRRATGGSAFVTLLGGMGELADALVEALDAAPLVELRRATPVVGLTGMSGGVLVRLADGEVIRSEAAIVTAPGPATAALLEPIAPAAAAAIHTIPHGTTAVVSLAYRREQFAVPPDGHGFLVAAGEPLTIDACTISSNKWPGRAPDGTVLLRAFVGSRSGRSSGLSDASLLAAVRRDLATTLGVRDAPLLSRIARRPGQMPQYTVGHLSRVAAVETALAAAPELVVAGAAYRGVGVPDCVRDGRTAARQVIDRFGGQSRERPELDGRVQDLRVDLSRFPNSTVQEHIH